MQEFITEEILALADIGLGRKHAYGVLAAKFARETAFTRPDRQQDIAGHADFSLDPRQGVAILRGEFSAARGERLECSLAQILRGCLHEFGLLWLLLGFSRNCEIGKRIVRLKSAHRRIEGRARDTKRLSVRPHRLKPAVECGIGTGGNGREQQPHKDDNGASGHAAKLVRTSALLHRERAECRRRNAPARSGFIGCRDMKQHVFLARFGAKHQ